MVTYAPATARPALLAGSQWRGLRLVALASVVVVLAGLVAGWVVLIWTPGHNILVDRSQPDALIVWFPNSVYGVQPGDRILAVDGAPVTDEAARAAFFRRRPLGDRIDLRIQRAGPDGRAAIEDVSPTIRSTLSDPQFLILCLASTFWALAYLLVAGFVVMARPDLRASRVLLVGGVISASSMPPIFLINQPTELWEIGARVGYVFPALAAIANLHLFLVFPQVHPLMRRLDRFGPIWFRRLDGGPLLLYSLPVAVAIAIGLGPIAYVPAALLVYLVCSLGTLLVMIGAYRRAETPLVRPQLKWILSATAFSWVVVLSMVGIELALGREIEHLPRAAFYASQAAIAVATAFAILRHRLFDVDRFLRAAVTYGLLSALLVGGYLLLVVVGTRLAGSAIDFEADSQSIPILAAAGMAILALPLRNRLQGALERLIYRSQISRRRLLSEASELLGRTQSLDTVSRLLVVDAPRQLDLDGAWLVLPASLRPPEPSAAAPAPAPALLERLADLDEPAFLSAERLGDEGIPVLSAADPVLAPWYAAGARVVVPLSVGESRGASAERRSASQVGVWVLGGARSGSLPERDDFEVLAQVGQQAAVLLDYARLIGEHVRQALLRQDLLRAYQIQQRLLPPAHPGWPGRLEIAARLQPAHETSGDFYDFYELRPRGESVGSSGQTAGRFRLQLSVGDVQGKGVGAALVMALAASALRAVAETTTARDDVEYAPGQALGVVGGLLNRSVGQRDFVCCALALVELDELPSAHPRLRLANAGQVPPMLWRGGNSRELRPRGEALPLGLAADTRYDELSVDLEPGDVVVFASDGLLEARAAPAPAGPGDRPAARPSSDVAAPTRPGEFFSFDRYGASVRYWAARASSAQGILDGIWADVSTWCGHQLDHDDVLLVVLRVPGQQCEEAE